MTTFATALIPISSPRGWIVPRAVVVIEAATAIVILDRLIESEKNKNLDF